MSRRLAAWVCVVRLFLFVGSPAEASEAPSQDVGVHTLAAIGPGHAAAFDFTSYRKARTRWTAGLALGLIGPTLAFAGAWLSLSECFLDCSSGGGAGGTSIAFLGSAAAVVGMGLALSGAFGQVHVLRHAGFDVSNAPAVAAALVPVAMISLAIGAGALGSPEAAAVAVVVGYASLFALTGGQMAVDASKTQAWRSQLEGPAKKPASVVVTPTWSHKSPGLAVAARW